MIVQQTQIYMDYSRSCTALLTNFDILHAIWKVQTDIKSVCIQYHDTQHVNGHQDSVKQFNECTRKKYLIFAQTSIHSQVATYQIVGHMYR